MKEAKELIAKIKGNVHTEKDAIMFLKELIQVVGDLDERVSGLETARKVPKK